VSLERFSRLLTVPTLLIHGSADSVIPVTTSDRFAAMNRLVTYYRPTGVGHVRAWNTDPVGYERRLTDFLRRLGIREPGKAADAAAAAEPC